MEQPVPLPPAEQGQAQQVPEVQDRTKLGDILNRAAEAGAEPQKKSREKWGGRKDQLRDAGKAAWEGARDAGKKTDAILRGITKPDVRAEMGKFLKERAGAAKDRVSEKQTEIKDRITDKKDALITGFQDKVRAARDGIKEKFIQPVVDRAKAIGDGVKNAALEGALFVADTIDVGAAAVDLGKATASAKAEQWSNKLSDFAKKQGERVTATVTGAKDKFVAGYHEAKANSADRNANRNAEAARRAADKAEVW